MNRIEDGEATRRVLCGANSYVEKYFFNPRFQNLPVDVQESLEKIAVVFTEDMEAFSYCNLMTKESSK